MVAGVSEPLLFHYERDFTRRSISSLNDSLDGAESLEEILRIYETGNYDQCDEDSVIDMIRNGGIRISGV